MEMVVVLDVKVCSPMADLRCTLKLGNFEDREVKRIVDNNLLLLLVDEAFSGGGRDLVERAIGDSSASLGHNCVGRKLNILRSSVRVNLRAGRPVAQVGGSVRMGLRYMHHKRHT